MESDTQLLVTGVRYRPRGGYRRDEDRSITAVRSRTAGSSHSSTVVASVGKPGVLGHGIYQGQAGTGVDADSAVVVAVNAAGPVVGG